MNECSGSINSGLNLVLTESLTGQHILFLYSSKSNKDKIRDSFLAMSRIDEKLVYVTDEKVEQKNNSDSHSNIHFSVISPKNIDSLKEFQGKLRIIIDDAAVHEKVEELTAANNKNTILCMFDLSKLEPEKIKKLVSSHDRLILNTPDITMLSGETLKKSDVREAAVERFVKDYLDVVVLALIASRPMCGMDILDTVHKNFNVLLSPGTIYPLLHKLKKERLLECECGIKKKMYRPASGSEENIRNILDKHRQANEFLNGFLSTKDFEAVIK